MKRVNTFLVTALTLLALATVSCEKEKPNTKPEEPQKVSLVNTQWERHDEQTGIAQGRTYTLVDEMLIEFETDSSGCWKTTSFINGTSIGTLTIEFTYEFDGATSGKVTLSPESSPTPDTPSIYTLTYDATAMTILLVMERNGEIANSYLFHQKQDTP